jgi:hypothetical protein
VHERYGIRAIRRIREARIAMPSAGCTNGTRRSGVNPGRPFANETQQFPQLIKIASRPPITLKKLKKALDRRFPH